MKRAARLSALAVALLACEREPAKPAISVPAPIVSPSTVAVAAVPPDAAPRPSDQPLTAQDASAPLPPPVKVQRTGKVWPFHAWNRAEAVMFNPFAMQPDTPLRVYDDVRGWSQHIVGRKPLEPAQGKKAVDFVVQTNGDVDVSMCPFPRHAVVLYEDALPIATINVCFSCGDIMLWPRWEPEPDWSKMNDKQMKETELRHDRQMKLYDKVFPKWQAFFRDEVGFPIDATYH